MKPDLLNGSGFRAVLRFSLPMILGAFIQQIYTVTDSLVVGNVVGSDALAAIGATGTCIFFLLSLNSGLANACSVVLAQAYGAGSKRDIAASLASTLYYTGLCALVLGVGGGFCVEPLLRLMQTPEDRGVDYISGTCVRCIRYLALLISLLLPAVYVAMTMFHPEMIPDALLQSIIESKKDVPFSTILEVLGLLAAFEILQEAGLHLPQAPRGNFLGNAVLTCLS